MRSCKKSHITGWPGSGESPCLRLYVWYYYVSGYSNSFGNEQHQPTKTKKFKQTVRMWHTHLGNLCTGEEDRTSECGQRSVELDLVNMLQV